MHIVWINTHASHEGGCEHYIYDTVRHLKNMGHQCTLLYDVSGSVDPVFAGIFDGAYVLVDVEMQVSLLGADVVYVHQLEVRQVLRALPKLPIPVVRFFHDHKLFCLREHKYTSLTQSTCQRPLGIACYSCLGFVNKTQEGIRIRSLRGAEDLLMLNRKLDKFVVGSKYMAAHLRAHGFDASKIVTAPLFVDTPVVDAPVDERCVSEKRDYPVPPDHAAKRKHTRPTKVWPTKATLRLLFVGQLIQGKGLDVLIEAMRKVPKEVALTICGAGKNGEALKKQVSRFALEDRIRFVGRKTTERLRVYYESCDVVVIPARAPETFCRVGLEALHYGKPVIATNVGGMGDWFKPDVNGLECQSNDAKSLSDAILTFAKCPHLISTLGNKIGQMDLSTFSAARHINTLLSVFESVVEAS